MNKQDKGTSTKQLSAAVSGRLLASKFFVLAALITSLAALGADFIHNKQKYFVDSPDGVSTEVFPLSEPNVTPSSLVKWVTQAVTSTYTIDFYQYQETLDGLKQYFTIAGYDNYLGSLKASGSLDKIIKEKLVMSAVALDTALIMQEGEMNGVYSWKVQLPLLINYQGASTTGTQKTVAVNVLVTRVPTNLAPKGIGIAQIIDEEYHV